MWWKDKKWNERRNEKEEWIVNQIGDEGAKRISESLKINTSLTELDLGSDEKIRNKREKMKWSEMKEWIDNQIGNEGAKTISESLKINTSLTELNLEGDEKDKKWIRENWNEMKRMMNSEPNRRWRSKNNKWIIKD